jgi:hypothetical protein
MAAALNMTGVWKVPALFVVNNNGAISVPRAKQTAAATLAQKAITAGIPGKQVDSNDFAAVRLLAERALARHSEGSTSTPLPSGSRRRTSEPPPGPSAVSTGRPNVFDTNFRSCSSILTYVNQRFTCALSSVGQPGFTPLCASGNMRTLPGGKLRLRTLGRAPKE